MQKPIDFSENFAPNEGRSSTNHFVWLQHHQNGQLTVFVGIDHENILTKKYCSFKTDTMISLARKMAIQYKCEIIEEHEQSEFF